MQFFIKSGINNQDCRILVSILLSSAVYSRIKYSVAVNMAAKSRPESTRERKKNLLVKELLKAYQFSSTKMFYRVNKTPNYTTKYSLFFKPELNGRII